MTTLSINPQDTWALLIGVGNFTHDKTLPAIPAVTNNLAKLRQLLANDTIVGIPPEQIKVIENQTDILQQIIQKLPDHPVETLFIYYAGHGIYDGDQCLYLATPNTLQANSQTALAFASVWDSTFQKAQNLIYILDCCRSGKALNTMTKQVGKNISVLTTTLPNKNAKAPKNEEHSSFTKQLMELLENGFGKSPTLTTTEIYKELGQRLSKEGSPKPWGEDFLDTEESLQIAYNRAFPKKTVFLAEVTDDLESCRNMVKVFLEQQRKLRKDIEIRILPTQDYDVSSEKLTEYLQQSDLFVQLLSHLPGKKDLAKTQYDGAKTAGITILQWRSKNLELAKVQNEAHRQLLKGETVKSMEPTEFQDEILQQLFTPTMFTPKSSTASKLTAGALVMVNTTQEEVKLPGEIKRFLKGKQIAYATAAIVSGKILAGQKHLDEKEHTLKCTYCFEGPDFPSEKLALKWLLLSHPTTTP